MTRKRSGGGHNRQQGNYKRHDGYYHKAKQEGYAARSAYKLEEIAKRTRLLKRGARILDLGCAPGAWLQYASAQVGARGVVVGVDLERVTIALPDWVKTVVGDLEEMEPSIFTEMAGGRFDVVLSDLAPHTTGIQHVDQTRSLRLVECAAQVAGQTLATGGGFIAKLFEGGDIGSLSKMLRQDYRELRKVRPKATRSHSKEIYLVATGRKAQMNPASTDPADTDPADTDPADTDPADTDPASTDPASTDPASADPASADPAKEA